jgi:hypothetical protein
MEEHKLFGVYIFVSILILLNNASLCCYHHHHHHLAGEILTVPTALRLVFNLFFLTQFNIWP